MSTSAHTHPTLRRDLFLKVLLPVVLGVLATFLLRELTPALASHFGRSTL